MTSKILEATVPPLQVYAFSHTNMRKLTPICEDCEKYVKLMKKIPPPPPPPPPKFPAYHGSTKLLNRLRCKIREGHIIIITTMDIKMVTSVCPRCSPPPPPPPSHFRNSEPIMAQLNFLINRLGCKIREGHIIIITTMDIKMVTPMCPRCSVCIIYYGCDVCEGLI